MQLHVEYGYRPSKIYHIAKAYEKGLGEMNANRIDTVGDTVEGVRRISEESEAWKRGVQLSEAEETIQQIVADSIIGFPALRRFFERAPFAGFGEGKQITQPFNKHEPIPSPKKSVYGRKERRERDSNPRRPRPTGSRGQRNSALPSRL